MEARPAASAGFTFGVAVVLLVPVLNLFARPLTIIAASLWLGHEQWSDTGGSEGTSTQIEPEEGSEEID
jgi:uncharacterized protein involved in cysteine biosynthesis